MSEFAMRRYANFFANLRRESVGDLRNIATPCIRFTDPFNAVNGVDQVTGLLRHMFDTSENPTFLIRDQIAGKGIAFITWDFNCRIYGLGALTITGASEIHFDEDHLVCQHIDHWDAASQLYEKLPGLGIAMRFVKRRFIYHVDAKHDTTNT